MKNRSRKNEQIVSKGGSIRAVKNKPGLNWDEIAIQQNLELPDALFFKPTLEATVIIPESAAINEPMEADVIANVKEAIEAATGLNIRLSLMEIDKD